MDAAHVNVWLAMWGAIGPVLVAGVSSWYNRRGRAADRKFRADVDREHRAEERKAKLDDAAVADHDRALSWRRNTHIDFLSASFDFAWQGSGPQEYDVRERHRERFAKSFSTLSILDPAISTEACAVWEACNRVPAVRDQAEHASATADLAAARGRFAAKAHELLALQLEEIKPKISG
jgi:hypothetical protein